MIQKAKEACRQNGQNPDNHFPEAGKMIKAGKGANRLKSDYILSRYACYLIAMNGNSTKPEIAAAQNYFAIQTRRSEFADQMREAGQRVDLRERLKEDQQYLMEAARDVGVTDYGEFTNSGYLGLYGGFDAEQIKLMKGLPEKANLADRMGRAELAANSFRATQTEIRLKNDSVEGQAEAVAVHYEVGTEVRNIMQKTGGAMPEDLELEVSDVNDLAKMVDRYNGKNYKPIDGG